MNIIYCPITRKIKKAAFLFCLFVFLFNNNALAGDKKSFPLRIVPGFTIKNQQYKPNYSFEFVYGDRKVRKYGNLTKLEYSAKGKQNTKKFFNLLKATNPGLKLLKPSNKGAIRYYTFIRSGKKYTLKVTLSGKNYRIVAIEESDFPRRLIMGSNKATPNSKNLKSRVPNSRLLPFIDGYHVSIGRYSKYDKMKFSYKVDRKNKSFRHEGQVWKMVYKQNKGIKADDRYLLSRNFYDEIIRLGGKILFDDGTKIVFSYQDHKTETYGIARSFSNSLNLSFVTKKVFKQTLFINPDQLKSELDKMGKVTLKGIFFDTNKATLKPKSKKAIEAVVSLMQQYGDLVIEIQGHTDNVGKLRANQILSERRASSVLQAIVNFGISKNRLVAKGFGESSPAATNDSAEGRAINRRVELHKISGGKSRTIVSIDFFKPIPGSYLEGENEYSLEAMRFPKKQFSFAKPDLSKLSSVKRYRYRFKGGDGKTDMSVAPLEILKNYQAVLKMLGGNKYKVVENSLYFNFPDRGDKTPLLGVIRAFKGSYEITFFISGNKSNNKIIGNKENKKEVETNEVQKDDEVPENGSASDSSLLKKIDNLPLLSGAKVVERINSYRDSFTMRKPMMVTIQGEAQKNHIKVFDKSGSQNHKVTAKDVIKFYDKNLLSNGYKRLEKLRDTCWYIDPTGAGKKPVYVRIEAYSGAYTITLLVPQ